MNKEIYKFDQPSFAEKVDDEGRKYHTLYGNRQTKAVVSFGNKNIVYSGNPKINLRLGDSKFGEEIFFELWCDGEVKETPKRTHHDSIEIYLPKDEGIKFLKYAISHFEEVLRKIQEPQIVEERVE